jgi:thiamine monophosphate synthase
MAQGVHKITEDFEKALCDYTGAPYAIALDNMSNAIFLALYYEKNIKKESPFNDHFNQKLLYYDEIVQQKTKDNERRVLTTNEFYCPAIFNLLATQLHKIPLYIYNNYSLAIKIKAHGIFLDSSNKNLSHLFNKKLKVIGVAHCHLDYFNKLKQQCNLIFLSPIFFNKKYSPYKIKRLIKFNLQTIYWKVNKALLGGITKKRIKFLSSLNELRFGGISYFEE